MHSLATTTPSFREHVAGVMPAGVVRMARAVPLDVWRLLRDTLLIVALLALNAAGTAGSAVFFAILAVMLVVSPEAAFKALAICYLGLMINSAFVPKSLVWTPARLVLPILALVRFSIDMAALRLTLLTRSSYLALLAFVAVMAVCSVVSGWYTQIALLKLVNFLAFLTAVFAGTAVVRHRRSDVSEWFVSLILAATVFGIMSVAVGVDNNFRPMRVSPYEIVYAAGFNGAFLHPNAHAIYASLFVAFLGIVWLLSRYRHTWLALPPLACWLVFLAWSESRTAFVATAVAFLLLVAFARPLRTRSGARLWPKVSRRTLVGIGIVATIVALFFDATTGGSLGKTFTSFILKGATGDSGSQVTLDRVMSSRKALISSSWENFEANPVFGIGFGVAKTEDFRRTATLFTAPAEKGFLPTAILEEGGIVGTAAFLVFLAALTWDLTRERNVAGLIMLWVFVATNLGEVTIFAPGGGGAFGWMAVGAGMILGDRCWAPPPGPRAAGSTAAAGWRP